MTDVIEAVAARWTDDPARLPAELQKSFRAVMGWGGVAVWDESVDIVDLTREFAARVVAECCGQCFPCRIGMHEVSEILDEVCAGRGSLEGLERARALGRHVAESARCDLGRTGGAGVLEALERYAERFERAVIAGEPVSRGTYAATVVAPCMAACPAGVDIPAYVEQLRIDDVDRSADAVRRRCPMPATIGRVCVRPCEDACRRGPVDEPIAIRTLKRFVADSESDVRACPLPGPAKVAIIGAGPAGLACAYYLAIDGIRSTIFEALPEAGGMAAVGIPDYRLPRQALRAEVARVEALGVEIRYNARMGVDVSMDELFAQGCEAVFVAVGAHQSALMGCEGEDAGYRGFMPGVEFLREIAFGRTPLTGKTLLVIGGGNVAMDCVRSARRLGFGDVRLLYRRTEAEMPADRVEITEAKEEGVAIHTLVAPVRILAEGGRVVGLECRRMELGEPDASGRRRPEPVPDSEFVMECDAIVAGYRPSVQRRRTGARASRSEQVEDPRGRPADDAVGRSTRVRRRRLLHGSEQPGRGAGRGTSCGAFHNLLPAWGVVRAGAGGTPGARHVRACAFRAGGAGAVHRSDAPAACAGDPAGGPHQRLRRGRGTGAGGRRETRSRTLPALLSHRRGGAVRRWAWHRP